MKKLSKLAKLPYADQRHILRLCESRTYDDVIRIIAPPREAGGLDVHTNKSALSRFNRDYGFIAQDHAILNQAIDTFNANPTADLEPAIFRSVQHQIFRELAGNDRRLDTMSTHFRVYFNLRKILEARPKLASVCASASSPLGDSSTTPPSHSVSPNCAKKPRNFTNCTNFILPDNRPFAPLARLATHIPSFAILLLSLAFLIPAILGRRAAEHSKRASNEFHGPRPQIELMVVPGVDPHGFGFAGALETALAVKFEGARIGHDDVLVETFVTRDEQLHNTAADPAAVIFGKDQEMRVIDHEVAVGNGVAKADECGVVPRRDQGVGGVERFKEEVGLFGGRPIVGAVEGEDGVGREVAGFGAVADKGHGGIRDL
jgi:hypothetical protein